jgi:L-asparaginase / beta-aspartyl-peptidase
MRRLIIHGGAGTIAGPRQEAYRRGLRRALDAGWQVLQDGGDAVEAVVRAVSVMEEDEEAFNAGVGSSLTRDGTVECDACLVRGSDGAAGAVALVTRSRTPIRVARRVLEGTPHVFLAGPAADALVADPVPNEALVTAYSRSALDAHRARHQGPEGSATVGAVARDAAGDLAAATSTGGVLGQWSGRIGDAPVIGAGTYADRRVAISCTGKGEAFLRAVAAKGVALRMEAGMAPEAALARALDEVRGYGGSGGLILVGADGLLGYAFDTRHIAVAWRGDGEGMSEGALVDGDARVLLVVAPEASA